jgi:ABC-type dipeptide/oligopeptide/nickel transport system permease subunit
MTPPPAEKKAIDILNGLIALAMKAIEVGFVVVLCCVLLYVLLGAAAGPYVGSVVSNLSFLVARLTPQALIGVAVVITLGWIAKRPR